MKDKIVKLIKWLKGQLTDRTTQVIFVIVLAAMTIPTWLGYAMFFITRKGYFIAIATSYIAFWLAPFTPFWGIVLGLTILLRNIWKKFRRK